MTSDNYFAIAVGPVAIILGWLVFRYRVRVARIMADTQRAFGGRLGRLVAKKSSPFWPAVVGIGWMVMGVIMIFAGIFVRE
ncbi:hypothetical protein SAMN04488591_1838 [Microbacterium azadirachtae]|uniref:Uncharacterized protein n=1 Tax=Microbacterium azadirachtae TaxID=582680 RepID=A0A1I6HH84_9MICO|nr:hypothetical protein [Microbacterium azadirachtae]SFR53845.1 hypothetical protein SAMN04488591_1838 [Microbacterium azadirachtae]